MLVSTTQASPAFDTFPQILSLPPSPPCRAAVGNRPCGQALLAPPLSLHCVLDGAERLLARELGPDAPCAALRGSGRVRFSHAPGAVGRGRSRRDDAPVLEHRHRAPPPVLAVAGADD